MYVLFHPKIGCYRHIDVFNDDPEERNKGYHNEAHQNFDSFYKVSTFRF